MKNLGATRLAAARAVPCDRSRGASNSEGERVVERVSLPQSPRQRCAKGVTSAGYFDNGDSVARHVNMPTTFQRFCSVGGHGANDTRNA